MHRGNQRRVVSSLHLKNTYCALTVQSERYPFHMDSIPVACAQCRNLIATPPSHISFRRRTCHLFASLLVFKKPQESLETTHRPPHARPLNCAPQLVFPHRATAQPPSRVRDPRSIFPGSLILPPQLSSMVAQQDLLSEDIWTSKLGWRA